MDEIEPSWPQVSAVAIIDDQAFVLRMNRDHLARREAGDLVTAEVLTVIPTDQGDG